MAMIVLASASGSAVLNQNYSGAYLNCGEHEVPVMAGLESQPGSVWARHIRLLAVDNRPNGLGESEPTCGEPPWS